MRKVEISIIIPCGKSDKIKSCLDGLNRQENHTPFEVIIVGEPNVLSSQMYNFHLQFIPCKEIHTNIRRNLGIERARAPRIAFLDDDTIPDPNWLEAALSVDPHSNKIITGPEKPISSGHIANLIFNVCQNPFSERALGHFHKGRRPLTWVQVPFCNCVIPRYIFDKIALPSTNIPFEMDDTEFFHRIREDVFFYNEPNLSIRHDRYPDSAIQWLKKLVKRRIGLGEKVVIRPDIYCKIGAALICAFLPWVLLMIIFLVPWSIFKLLMVSFMVLYIAIINISAYLTIRKHMNAINDSFYGKLEKGFLYIGITALFHIITIISVQIGLFRGLLKRVMRNIRLSDQKVDSNG